MKKLVIKRTTASKIPFDNGKVIGEDIPPVQYTTARCMLTKTENAEYKRLVKATLDRDFMKTMKDTDRLMWTPVFRRMMLVCASLKFEHMLDLTLGRLREMRNAEQVDAYNLLRHCLKKQGSQSRFQLPEPHDTENILELHARGSPKMRFLMFVTAELVVLKQEKMTVWCALPSTQQWIQSVLAAAGIKAKVYRADMPLREKEELQQQFNETDDIEVLVLPFKGASCGLNLQTSCRNMVFFDPAPNMEIHEQAVGRHKRVGQLRPMRCIRLYLKGGWDEDQARTQANRSLVSLMTQLSGTMFEEGDEEDVSTGHMHEVRTTS
jgi:hypothetical protein